MTPVLLVLAGLVLGGVALPPLIHPSSSGRAPSTRSYATYGTSNELTMEADPSYGTSGQDRFHPTTYEEDEHKGEVVLPPLDSDSDPSASQDIAVDANSPQSGSFHSSSFTQGGDPLGVPQGDSIGSASGSDPQYDFHLPAPNYDYRPAPPQYPYNYPPPSPPPNFYLPAATTPPPPAPEPEPLMESTFYQIGAKIWFIPLWFSIYFVIYVTALLLKTVIKHKLFIPQTQFQFLTSAPSVRSYHMDELTYQVTRGLAQAAVRYLRHHQ